MIAITALQIASVLLLLCAVLGVLIEGWRA
jgi:hypothetical protein